MSHTVVYRTASNFEHKAARELQELGIPAAVPYDDTGKRKRVTAPGYVFAGRELHAAFVKHVRHKVGTARIDEVARLYLTKPKRRAEDDVNPYQAGDRATKGEIEVEVISTSGRSCLIAYEMLGKRHTQAIHYTQLRPG